MNDIDIIGNKIKRIPDDYSLESNAVEIILNSMIILNSDFDDTKEKFMEKLKDYLVNLSHSDKNKRYSPLASLILMKNQELKKTEYIYFKEHFIDSPGTPLVDLLIANEYYLDKQYEKCIQEANKLIEKYKEIVSPFGWKLVMDYYGLLIHCYIEMNDIENAEKYYEIIKKEAPDYYFLSKLKMLLRAKK